MEPVRAGYALFIVTLRIPPGKAGAVDGIVSDRASLAVSSSAALAARGVAGADIETQPRYTSEKL